MKKKIHIAVIMGGPSSEHEVSLKSGENILRALDKDAYEPTRVHITKKGVWSIDPKDLKHFIDCAFIALHGSYGEDGTVQGILSDYGIPFTGSGALPSALGMNKFLSLQTFGGAGLNIPETILIHKNEWRYNSEGVEKNIFYRMSLPFVVKPNREGSSVGVFIIRKKKDLEFALGNIFLFSKECLAQEFIEGREMTCGVLDYGWKESAFPLLPTEIIPREEAFFNYEAKYSPGASFEITPPQGLTSQKLKEIRNTALNAHLAIGASGMSRTDMILDSKGDIVVLEINTIPGLTEESLLPKAALISGIQFSKLLDIMISSAFGNSPH